VPREALGVERRAREALSELDDEVMVEVRISAPAATKALVPVGLLRRYLEAQEIDGRQLLFSADPERWLLKGATAMLARMGGHARHTRDIDLLSRTGSLDNAEQALRTAAAVDLDDYFSFTLSPGRQIAQGTGAARVDIVAFLGLKEFARFHVDLVADLAITGAPDTVPPLVPLDLPGLVSANYRAYPLADHVADKVCALLQPRARRHRLHGSPIRRVPAPHPRRLTECKLWVGDPETGSCVVSNPDHSVVA
jgi:Nucleotidyl transferase AbiEii toxin, Type IV TA system